MSALIIPTIAVPLHNTLHTSVSNLPHLMGLKLAHPVTNAEHFQISLLIGADFVSREQLFIDVSSEQRVQTYLQLAPKSGYSRGDLVAKMAFLCDVDQAKRLLVHYFMLQTYLLQPDGIFQAHSLASAEWEKIVQLKEASNTELSLQVSSHSSL